MRGFLIVNLPDQNRNQGRCQCHGRRRSLQSRVENLRGFIELIGFAVSQRQVESEGFVVRSFAQQFNGGVVVTLFDQRLARPIECFRRPVINPQRGLPLGSGLLRAVQLFQRRRQDETRLEHLRHQNDRLLKCFQGVLRLAGSV
jgi:hypothetical protein